MRYLIDSMATFNDITADIFGVENGILVIIDGKIEKHFQYYDNALAWLIGHGFEF